MPTQPTEGCDWEPYQRAFPLERIKIESNLYLRPLEQGDLDDLAAFLTGDPEMTWTRNAFDKDNVQYLLSLRLQHYKNFGFGPYGVLFDDKLIGMAGAQSCDLEPCSIEILAYIARDYWGKGLATICLQWAVARCRDQHISHIYAATREENAAANATAQRLGFYKIGIGIHFGYPATHWKLVL